MKLGYFCNPWNIGHKRDYRDILNEVRELARVCEQAGFDNFWLAEHHFSIWGREMLSNPLLMAADLAARTERIRIGLAAAIITFWHPLRLAEDIALLDQLCDGRLELGVGRGNYGLEGLNLNPKADPNNPADNFGVFEDTINIVTISDHPMTRLVDWHVHCYLPDHRSPEDVALQQRRNVAGDGQAEPERLRAAVDEAGLSQFVIISLPRRPDVHTPHEFIAERVAEYPGRAVGFASVDPNDPGAADEFERAIATHGLRGLKISPTYQSIDPRAPECWRLYEIADAHRTPVMFHCGGAYTGSLEWADPCLLDKVAMAFPELKLIVAHFGQPYMEQTAILMRKNENVYADISARTHRPWQLYHGVMIAIEYKVADRLLFGSDFPVRSPAVAIEEFRRINDWGAGVTMPRIPEETIEAILHERPLSMLGIEPAPADA